MWQPNKGTAVILVGVDPHEKSHTWCARLEGDEAEIALLLAHREDLVGERKRELARSDG